eukprot:UN02262
MVEVVMFKKKDIPKDDKTISSTSSLLNDLHPVKFKVFKLGNSAENKA